MSAPGRVTVHRHLSDVNRQVSYLIIMYIYIYMVWMNSGIAIKTRKKLLEMGNLKRKPKKTDNAIANIKIAS